MIVVPKGTTSGGGGRSAPPVTLDALHRALANGNAGVAIPVFDLLRLERPFDPAVSVWIDAGQRAFADHCGATTPVQPALTSVPPVATALLLARVAAGHGLSAVALTLARHAQDSTPHDPEPTFLLCILLLQAGDPGAQTALRACLTNFPERSQGWIDLGGVLLRLNKPEAALVCLARGTPTADLEMRRGRLAQSLGRIAEAKAAFAEAVRLDPRAPRAWFLLGTAAQDEGDAALAAEAYRQVLALDPRLAEAAVNLGTVLQEAGDLDGARVAYRTAVRRRGDTFGRVAQALSTSPKGEVWLDLGALRRDLAADAPATGDAPANRGRDMLHVSDASPAG